MNIWLIWHGNTWSIIEQVAKQRGHNVPIIALSNSSIAWSVDVYIDFSSAEWVLENMKTLCELKIPVVLGTTWWYDKKDEVEKLFLDSWNTCVWWWNFSIWVNLFYSIIQQATQKIDKFNKEYDVLIHEFHHKNKSDSPSWTAVQIWKFILENSSVKNAIVTERLDRKIQANELHISSTRWWNIPWTHQAIFDSDFDSIKLEHCARTREWFALWSVITAEKIKNLNPWFYNFAEIFNNIF